MTRYSVGTMSSFSELLRFRTDFIPVILAAKSPRSEGVVDAFVQTGRGSLLVDLLNRLDLDYQGDQYEAGKELGTHEHLCYSTGSPFWLIATTLT